MPDLRHPTRRMVASFCQPEHDRVAAFCRRQRLTNTSILQTFTGWHAHETDIMGIARVGMLAVRVAPFWPRQRGAMGVPRPSWPCYLECGGTSRRFFIPLGGMLKYS